MPSLKRNFIYESIEISDSEVDSRPARKSKRAEAIEVLDLTQTDEEEEVKVKVEDKDDDDDNGDAETAALATEQESARSASVVNTDNQPAVRPATSTTSHIPHESTTTEYRCPFEFHERPSFWQEWSGDEYQKFIEEVKNQFDPRPFSRLTGKTHEEIRHVWSTLMTTPLDKIAEAMKSGEDDWRQEFEALNKFGSAKRQWDGDRIVGELQGINTGTVWLITLAEKSEGEAAFEGISEDDLEWLKRNFDESRWRIVPSSCEVEEREEVPVDQKE